MSIADLRALRHVKMVVGLRDVEVGRRCLRRWTPH